MGIFLVKRHNLINNGYIINNGEGDKMQELMINLISQYGYVSILFLIAIENIFPPIPSEVILCFSGFISHEAHLNLLLIIFFSTMGSLIGALILYFFGFLLSKERILCFAQGRLGKILHFKVDKIEKSITCFQERGAKTVFFCRFIPIIRSLISIPAGIAKYPLPTFLILTSLGSVIWNSILILLGNILGENWYFVANFFDTYTWWIVGFVLISYIGYKSLKKRFKKEVIPIDDYHKI